MMIIEMKRKRNESVGEQRSVPPTFTYRISSRIEEKDRDARPRWYSLKMNFSVGVSM